jgi:hypothetical protein
VAGKLATGPAAAGAPLEGAGSRVGAWQAQVQAEGRPRRPADPDRQGAATRVCSAEQPGENRAKPRKRIPCSLHTETKTKRINELAERAAESVIRNVQRIQKT